MRRTTSEIDVVAYQRLGFTGVGFLDHLLAQYVVNSQVDLKPFFVVLCFVFLVLFHGDLWTDWHHSVLVPMDGSLTRLSADFSGRPRLF
ncbi:hypothetical protein AAHH87_00350 [Candidatus Hodgkinia cicadicola]